MIKRMVIVIIALIIIFVAIFGYDALRSPLIKRKEATYQPPATAVSTTKVVAETWQPTLDATGS